jgi:hypothetical protein
VRIQDRLGEADQALRRIDRLLGGAEAARRGVLVALNGRHQRQGRRGVLQLCGGGVPGQNEPQQRSEVLLGWRGLTAQRQERLETQLPRVVGVLARTGLPGAGGQGIPGCREVGTRAVQQQARMFQ